MPKITVPITKKVVTYRKAMLDVQYTPGYAVEVRLPTRRKLEHKLFRTTEHRKMAKFLEKHQGMDIVIRRANVVVKF